MKSYFIKYFLFFTGALYLTSCSYYGKNEVEIREKYLNKLPLGSSMDYVTDYLYSNSYKILSDSNNKPCRKKISEGPLRFEKISKYSIKAQLGTRINLVLPQYIFATWCFDNSEKLTEFYVNIITDG